MPIERDRALNGASTRGEWVDVLATYGTGEAAYTITVARRAQVVDVADTAGGLGSDGRVVVTLALSSPDDVMAATHASAVAVVTVVRSTRAGDDAGADRYSPAPGVNRRGRTMTEHFVVLGVARVRSAWFRDISRWSTSAALPVEFVKCVSSDEVRARLASGRPFSALLIDGALPALDRDLTDTARSAGCAVVAVDDGRARRDWAQIGVDAVLSEPADRDAVLAVLREHARPVASFTADVDAARGRHRLRRVARSTWSWWWVVAV